MTTTKYDELVLAYRRIIGIDHAMALMDWDMQCMMLDETDTNGRVQAMTTLAGMKSNLVTETLALLQTVLSDKSTVAELNEFDRKNLDEMKRQLMLNDMPAELSEAITAAKGKATADWGGQKKTNDWEGYSKNLEVVVNAIRRQAAVVQKTFKTDTLYDACLLRYEPGMTEQEITTIFDGLKSWLPSMIKRYKETDVSVVDFEPIGPFGSQEQLDANKRIVAALGIKCRVDHTEHPFMTTIGEASGDVRIATKHHADYFQSIYGTVHESGHASYEIALGNLFHDDNLKEKYRGAPIMSARSMGIHEGQSIFYERQIGTKRPFLEWLKDIIGAEFIDPVVLEKRNLTVVPSLIRVEADEMTYPLHIILRFELERDLINGVIEVSDLPRLWNAKMLEYLGVEPTDNSTGVMQDVHWPSGAFGYFPSYTIGALFAAQMMESMEQVFSVDAELENRSMAKINEWLNEHVWKHGCLKATQDLIRDATGSNLSDQPFKRFLSQRRA